jgi:hypothetical protein
LRKYNTKPVDTKWQECYTVVVVNKFNHTRKVTQCDTS